jgi:flagellar protein FlbD
LITLTRLNHNLVTVNSDLIESIESTPDTVLRMTNGQKLVVREVPDEVVERVKQFKCAINHCLTMHRDVFGSPDN